MASVKQPQTKPILPVFVAALIYSMWHRSPFATTLSEPTPALTFFTKFTTALLSSSSLPITVPILALKYVHRLRTLRPHLRGAHGSECRLLVVTLMTAMKFLIDNTYANKTWAKLARIPVAEINTTEMEFMAQLGYNFSVPEWEYDEWLRDLDEAVAVFREYSQLNETPREAISFSPRNYASNEVNSRNYAPSQARDPYSRNYSPSEARDPYSITRDYTRSNNPKTIKLTAEDIESHIEGLTRQLDTSTLLHPTPSRGAYNTPVAPYPSPSHSPDDTQKTGVTYTSDACYVPTYTDIDCTFDAERVWAPRIRQSHTPLPYTEHHFHSEIQHVWPDHQQMFIHDKAQRKGYSQHLQPYHMHPWNQPIAVEQSGWSADTEYRRSRVQELSGMANGDAGTAGSASMKRTATPVPWSMRRT
jgi:Cyclin